jgi:hypothetical protein
MLSKAASNAKNVLSIVTLDNNLWRRNRPSDDPEPQNEKYSEK